MKKISCVSKTGKKFERTPTPEELKAFERQRKIYKMREKGETFREIGEKFSISAPRARQLYIKSKRPFVKRAA